jgi:hypothetical protein
MKEGRPGGAVVGVDIVVESLLGAQTTDPSAGARVPSERDAGSRVLL